MDNGECGSGIPVPVGDYGAVVLLTPHDAFDLTKAAGKAADVRKRAVRCRTAATSSA
jgi:hypothetical protein